MPWSDLKIRGLFGEGEFVEVAEGAPLGDDEVVVFVNGGAVGGVADADFPIIGFQAVIAALFCDGIVADLGDDIAVLIEESDAALEFGDDGVFAADVDGGGHAEILLDDFDEVAVEVPIFDAVIVAVADEEEGFFAASIEGDAVAGVEFAFLLCRGRRRI